MSLLARGPQAADSPWAESAERGPSLLGVPRGETPWAGYRGGVLIGTGQSPGPRQSPQLRKAKRVVIVGYNRPAFLSPTRSRLLLFPSCQPFRDLRSDGPAYGSESSGAWAPGVWKRLGAHDRAGEGNGTARISPIPIADAPCHGLKSRGNEGKVEGRNDVHSVPVLRRRDQKEWPGFKEKNGSTVSRLIRPRRITLQRSVQPRRQAGHTASSLTAFRLASHRGSFGSSRT